MGKRNADSIGHESPNKRVKYDAAAQQLPETPDTSDFVLSKELVVGTVLTDLNQKRWRVGKPIGK